MNLTLPDLPTVFLKPSTALGNPWPEPCYLPKITQKDNTGDYESELAVIIGKTAKNVSEEDALDYVLGYTTANDISSRTSQTNQSQWCFSKGFDGACPLGVYSSNACDMNKIAYCLLGPVVASSSIVPDPAKLQIKGSLNGNVVQNCGLK